MPYIEVDEVPEGAEALDLVSREQYEQAIGERDQYAAQRDDALAQVEQALAQAREAKAKYADTLLDTNSQQLSKPQTEDAPKPTTISTLFG